VVVSATGRGLSLVTTPGSFVDLSPAMADSSDGRIGAGREIWRAEP
jgi:hypothetical protein